MVKVVSQFILTLSVIFFSLNPLTAQDNDWRFTLGTKYAHGFLTENTQSMRLNLETGFQKNNFELRLEGSYLLNQQGERIRFSRNNQIFFGGYYRFSLKSLTPHFGGGIGLAHSESTEYGVINDVNELEFESSYNPLASLSAGLEIELNQLMSFNLECQQIFGKHIDGF